MGNTLVEATASAISHNNLKNRLEQIAQFKIELFGTGFYYQQNSGTYNRILDRWTDMTFGRYKTIQESIYNATIFDTEEEREAAKQGLATWMQIREILGQKLRDYAKRKSTFLGIET